jgi:hypothetical protein
VLLAVIALLAQAARDAPEGLSPAALAAIITGARRGALR